MKKKSIFMLLLTFLAINYVFCSSLISTEKSNYRLIEVYYKDSYGNNRIGTLEYNENNNIIKVYVKEVEKDYYHTIIYEYDENNNLIKECEETSEGYYYIIIYEYDENNNLIKECEETSDKGHYCTIIYEYDENNNLIKEDKEDYEGFHYIVTYEYNKNNNLSKKYSKIINDEGDEYLTYYIFEYSKEDYLINEYKYESDSNKLESITKYEYDDNGNLIERTCKQVNGNITTKLTNEYDSNGNLLKQHFIFNYLIYFESTIIFKYEKINSNNKNNNIFNDYIDLFNRPMV